mgnify:FL=1
MKDVREEITAKRKELALTQKEFASALGMGPNGDRTVRRWESGETSPSATELTFIRSLGYQAPFAQGDREDAPFTYIDLFAGIGGIRLPFQELGGKCVFSCEWDKYAQKTYRMNYGDQPAGDIHDVRSDDIPKFNVLLAGFPCQPFSLAGVSKKNRWDVLLALKTRRRGHYFSK